jgi:hypothetical protein
MRTPALLLSALCVLSACSSSSGSGSSAESSYPVSVGPIPLQPSEETTVCVVVPLDNPEDLVVDSFDLTLSPGSHHLLVYATTADVTSQPYPCSPFTGVFVGDDKPLVFANKPNVNWTFPAGIRQEIPAHSNIKLEAHYINATSQELQGHGTAVFHGMPKSQAPAYQPTDFFVWTTAQFNIPADAPYTSPQYFQKGIAGTHMYGITTHQHRLGTGVQVWESAEQGKLGTQLADDRDWANPSWRQISPQVDFDGTNGLTFQCSWTNTTDEAVTFGESALNEMCVVAGYYYPANGVDLCMDGRCTLR